MRCCEGNRTELEWEDAEGVRAHATLELPGCLEWSAYRGSTDPPLGWYSPAFGRKIPTTSLVGRGEIGDDDVDHPAPVPFLVGALPANQVGTDDLGRCVS